METLLLQRQDISRILSIDECMDAVEDAFRLFAEGKTETPKVLGIHVKEGGFHIKAGTLGLKRNYFVTKVNANFPANSKKYGLPTIQGVIVVFDADNGQLLAVMDSIEITIIRTGAATGVAAKYLSVIEASTVTICGCGNQGRISLEVLLKIRKIEKVFAFDTDAHQIEKLIRDFGHRVKIISTDINQLSHALRESQVIVSCTTSKEPFIHASDIKPGSFIAAVGADSEEKQELYPEVLASAKIVVDVKEQCITIGELHHAIKKGLVTADAVHAEIGEIIAGKKAGRESDSEIIIFDSTGTALQDVAAASIVYEKAMTTGNGQFLNFS